MRAVAILSAVALLAATAAAESIIRGDIMPHHSLEPPFVHDWWQEGIPHWDMGGHAVATNEMVRLTPQRPSRFGWLWNENANDYPWWEARMTFYARSRQNPGADGIAFWYVSDPFKGKEPGPVIGMPGDFKGIAVVFDSYDNDQMRDNPATVLLNNVEGKKTEWDTDGDLVKDAAFRCMFEHRNTAEGDPVEMILQYYQKRLTLRLRTTLRSSSEAFCGEINDIDLPLNWYFGVTATTGGLSDNHDVTGIEIRPLGEQMEHPSISEADARRQQPKKFDHDNDAQEKEYWQAK